jgi:integrase/recombinase XerC
MSFSALAEVIPYDNSTALGEVSDVHSLLATFLGDRKETTRAAYVSDLEDFARVNQFADVPAAIGAFLKLQKNAARVVATAYRKALLDRGLSPATINRRISTLRALVALAEDSDLIDWTLGKMKSLPRQGQRDTRGPGLAGFLNLLNVAAAQRGPKAARDVALLRCFFDLALRRNEIATLDLEHIDFPGERLFVLRKGYYERIPLTFGDETKAALLAWLGYRGTEPGPLFVTLDHRLKNDLRRITTAGIYTTIRELGKAAGFRVRPHGLRHASITHAMDLGFSMREVRRFSGHKTTSMLEVYDDNRDDAGGRISRQIGASAPTPRKDEE